MKKSEDLDEKLQMERQVNKKLQRQEEIGRKTIHDQGQQLQKLEQQIIEANDEKNKQ